MGWERIIESDCANEVVTGIQHRVLSGPVLWLCDQGNLDLLACVVTVSVETRRVVDALPTLALG